MRSNARGIEFSLKYPLSLVFLLFLWILSGCSSSISPSYYYLTPKATQLSGSAIHIIEVLPVGLPERLDRTQLILQNGNGEARILDNSRWTSTLSAELRSGLSAGLQARLGAIDRYNNISNSPVSYRISSDFSHFDVIEDSHVEVAVTWIIKKIGYFNKLDERREENNAVDADKQISELNCRVSFSQPILREPNKVTAIVKASNQSLSQVVEAMALSIIALDSGSVRDINHFSCS